MPAGGWISVRFVDSDPLLAENPAIDHGRIHARHHPTNNRPGTYEFTDQVAAATEESGIRDGITNVFCRHTSCSLVIMENADPSARHDLEAYLDRLVPEQDPAYTHTLEGPDDMPSHIKMALTRTSEVIPFSECRLQLGTWQGIFLWEHRVTPHDRRITISVVGA